MQPNKNDENKNESEGESKKRITPEVDPYAGLPPLKRPRKTVYKSTLQKREREKRRREHFNEGLQQLSEIVFQNDPSIVSGRDNQITHVEATATAVTNRGELVRRAAASMNSLIREFVEQEDTIAELEKTLAIKTSEYNLFLNSSPQQAASYESTIRQKVPSPGITNGLVSSLIGNNDHARLFELNRLSNIGLASKFVGTTTCDNSVSLAILQNLLSQSNKSLYNSPLDSLKPPY